MPKGVYTFSSSVESRTSSKSITVNSDSMLMTEVSVPGAKSGTLTTRGSDSAGTLTLSSGHGILTGDVIDVYFGGDKLRHTVTVGTVSGTSVPISSGTGDVLPALNTAVTCMVPHEEPCIIDGDEVTGIAAYAAAGGFIQYKESSAVAHTVRFRTSREGYSWCEGNPVEAANPLATKSVETVLFSHPQTTAQLMRSIIQTN